MLKAQLPDIPLSLYQSYSGQLAVTADGLSLFRDNESGSFTINIPACSDGSAPTIRAAYLSWVSRWEGFYDPDNPPAFDDQITVSFNGVSQNVTANDNYKAFSLFEKQLVDGELIGTNVDDITQHSVVDLSSLVSANAIAGNNTVSVSNFGLPTPNNNQNDPSSLTANFGAGLLVVYECNEPGVDTTSVFLLTGNDFFWCGDGVANDGTDIYGQYSDSYCLNFIPDETEERNVTIDGFFSGQSRTSPPIRGNRLFYQTDESTVNPAPANPQNIQQPLPDVVGSGSSFVGEFPPNSIWNSNIGREWAVANDQLINLPQNHDYFCIQGWSNQNNGSGPCGSLLMTMIAFTIKDVGLAPVDLLGFEGNEVDGLVELNWATASELNNSHFIIERGADGQNFKTIGKIEGMGTTSEFSAYEFVDVEAPVGQVYYRLRQVDFDGAVAFSNIVVVNIEGSDIAEVLSAHPNPVSDVFYIQTNLDRNAHLVLKLFDISGKLISQEIIPSLKGRQQIRIPMQDYAEGMYFYQINAGGHMLSGKLIRKN